MIWLGVIVLLGLLPRLYKFHYGLPGFFVPDTQVLSEAMDMGNAVLQHNFGYFWIPQKYPLIFPYLILFAHTLVFGGGKILGIFSSASDFLKFISLHQEFSFLIGRAIALVSGTLIIVLSFFSARILARRFGSKFPDLAGLVAAFLTSFSLLLVHFSKFERPHILAGMGLGLTYFCFLEFLEYPSRNRGVLLALASGFTIGTLQTGLLVLIFPLLAVIYILRNNLSKQIILWVVLIIAVLFILSYPSIVLSPLKTIDSSAARFDVTLSGGSHPLAAYGGKGFPKIFYNIFVYDPAIFLLSFLGLALLIKRARLKALVAADYGGLASFVILFVLAFGLQNINSPRYDILLVIIVTIFAGVVVAELKNLLPKLFYYTVLTAAVTLALVQVSRLTYLLSIPDTRDLATDWVVVNTKPEDIFLENNSVLTLTPSKPSILLAAQLGGSVDRRDKLLLSLSEEEYPYRRANIMRLWKIPGAVDREFLQSRKITYLILSDDSGFRENPGSLYNFAKKNLQLIADFTPAKPGAKYFFSPFPADFENPLEQLWLLARLGPEVRIYKVAAPN